MTTEREQRRDPQAVETTPADGARRRRLLHSGPFWTTCVVVVVLLLASGLLVGQREMTSAPAFLAAHPADG